MMHKILVIGDSHLKRVNKKEFNSSVKVIARGGLQDNQIGENFFEFNKDYDAFILLVGGKDIHFHEYHNQNPKLLEETANHQIRCQFPSISCLFGTYLFVIEYQLV